MKRLVMFILLIISINAFSQDVKKININIGCGTNYSIPYSKSYMNPLDGYKCHVIKNFKSSLGYYFDIMIDYQINNHIILSTGPNFYQVRFGIIDNSYPNGLNGWVDTCDIRTINLSLPVFIKYKISDKVPISVGFGPYFSIIVRAKEIGSKTNNPYFISYGRDTRGNGITSGYTTFDFGTAFSVDYTFIKTKNISVFLFSKFNYGLINVRKEDQNYGKTTWKNYNLLTGLGIKF